MQIRKINLNNSVSNFYFITCKMIFLVENYLKFIMKRSGREFGLVCEQTCVIRALHCCITDYSDS